MRKITAIILTFVLMTVSFSFAFANEAELVKITAPNGATVKLFSQKSNYNSVEIKPSDVVQNGENIIYTYNTENCGALSYRAEKDGFITKTGYIQMPQSVTVEFSENEDASAVQNDVAVIENRLENSVLLGVNAKNFVHLKAGEEYAYRAYRNAWQIINKDTENVVIEPDFSHKVIYGKECVSIKQTEDLGNAGDNGAALLAKNDGIAIIEVSYGAVDVGGDTRYIGRYGASEKNRNGALIVKVGGESENVNIGFEWDSERDTLYFTGENGIFTIMPHVDNDSIKQVAVLSLNDGENADFASVFGDGNYDIPVHEGNNAVRITLESGKEDYFIVRGKKVSVDIENTNGSSIINPGDTVKIHIDGLYMPIPKMGGIYNPYQNKIVYESEALNEFSSKGKQYDFAKTHSLELSVPSDFKGDVYTLKNGYIYTEMYCSKLLTHRNIGKDGTDTNTNAVLVKKAYSVLPDIYIALGETKTLFGDVNLDGKTNSRDIAYLQRQVMGVEIKTEQADVSGDGRINSRDIAHLQKLIISGGEG